MPTEVNIGEIQDRVQHLKRQLGGIGVPDGVVMNDCTLREMLDKFNLVTTRQVDGGCIMAGINVLVDNSMLDGKFRLIYNDDIFSKIFGRPV